MKQGVKVAETTAGWRWEGRFGNDFEENKKMFYKEVKRSRKGEKTRDEMLEGVHGLILRDDVEVGGSEQGILS